MRTLLGSGGILGAIAMEDVRRADDLEKLLSELSWLKRLASALVRDESDANDLVQETWLVAAEHAPTDGRPLKPWLSRVALNLVRMRSRASKRRLAREAAVEPSSDSAPTPDALVGRLRAQSVVADEVLRLAEPYRNTVLLHYFEDLSSAEIARRSGIPEGTVRRRLKVALDELRGRLHAEERKTGQAIVAALAPLAVQHSAASVGSTLRRPRCGWSDRRLRAGARRCDRGRRARPANESARRWSRGPRDDRLAVGRDR